MCLNTTQMSISTSGIRYFQLSGHLINITCIDNNMEYTLRIDVLGVRYTALWYCASQDHFQCMINSEVIKIEINSLEINGHSIGIKLNTLESSMFQTLLSAHIEY